MQVQTRDQASRSDSPGPARATGADSRAGLNRRDGAAGYDEVMRSGVRRLGWVIGAAVAACKSRPTPPARHGDAAVAAAVDTAAVAVDAATAERWGGAILVPSQPPLEFELVWDTGRATMAIPAQHLAATPLVDVASDGAVMTFTLVPAGAAPPDHARFRVERAADGQTARGTLAQHGGEYRVRMKRLGADEHVGAGPTRPQTPIPPFPYDLREAQYASADGTRLAGTLTVPRGGGRYPAVLLISGTGAQDRDETIAGHQPFWVLADHLTRAGIAVLRVDDRGVGGSGGDTAATDLDGKVADVAAGLAWLRQQPDLDGARLGLIGHSEGGLIAPMAASQPALRVGFVIALAGPGLPGRDVSLHQLAAQLRARGAAPALIDTAVAGQRALLDAQATSADPAVLTPVVEAHLAAMAAALPEAERAAVSGDARARLVADGVAGLASAASRSFSRTDPAPYWRQVTCPALALNGALDLQVLPDENLAAIAAANPAVTTRVLPGLNHLFQPARRGLPDEYPLIETTIDPAALDAIGAWLTTQLHR